MKKLLCISLLAMLTCSLSAQTAVLKGIVTDAEYGDPLISAYIEVLGQGAGTITDFDGNYFIELEEGQYKVKYAYQGFDSVIKTVDLRANKELIINVVLSESKNVLREAVVQGVKVKNTDRALITMKQKSNVVFDGMSAEQMNRQAAGNAAGALKRVTGVSVEGGKYILVRGLGDRYSKTVLNGSEVPSLDPDRNSVQMDMFPSNMINNLQVFKSFSPDLPGDFSGGLINIETKDFPSKFFLSVKASYGGNSQVLGNNDFLTYEGGKTDWLGFDDGTRAIPTNVAQVEIPEATKIPGSDHSELSSLSRSFNDVMAVQTKRGGINQGYSVSIGNSKELFGRPIGFYLGGSYKRRLTSYANGEVGRYNAVSSTQLNPQFLLSDSRSSEQVITGIFANAMYKVNSRNRMRLTLMRNQNGNQIARSLSGQWAEDGSVSEDMIFNSQTLQYLQRTMNNAQLSATHELDESSTKTINWSTSTTLSEQDEPDLRFIAYDYEILEEGGRRYAIQKNAYDLPSRFYRNMKEVNWHTKAEYAHNLKEIFEDDAEMKFGMSYLIKKRDFQERRFGYFESDEFNGNLDQFFSSENMIGENYPLSGNPHTYVIPYEGDDLKNSYTGFQSVGALFAQASIPLIPEKFYANGGLRVETTNIAVESLDEDLRKGELDNIDLLPALNLIYKIRKNDKLRNIRASYSRTLARPSFRELAPFSSFFFTGDYVLIGNPELERSLIQNFDLRYEYFPANADLISFSLFYKDLKNPIEKTQNPIASNTEITFTNVGDSKLYGLEMELNKSLSQYAQYLQWVKVGVNASLIYSQVDIDSLEYSIRREIDENASDTRPMYSQSPYLVNAYLSYDNDSSGTSINLSFNVFGKRLALVSQGDLPDVYELPRPSLDLSITQEFKNKFTFSANIKNMLNPQTRFVHEYGGQEYNYSSFSRGIGMGFSLKYAL